jgi:hypothetical protein
MKITIGQVSRAKVPKQVSWRDLPKDVGAEEAVGQASRARGIDGEKYGPNSEFMVILWGLMRFTLW